MKTRVYKLEVMVIDHDHVGEEGIQQLLEHTRYPNHAIHPYVMRMESREVDWDDDHPLNDTSTSDAAYEQLFASDVTSK